MDFLYHVFASVLDEPAVGRGMKRLRGGLERGGEGDDGEGEGAGERRPGRGQVEKGIVPV